LSIVNEAQVKFQRDKDVDLFTRSKTVSAMTSEVSPIYKPEDEDLIIRVNSKFQDFAKTDTLVSDDLLVDLEVGVKAGVNNSLLMIGRAEAIIDASIEDVAAWDFDVDSRYRLAAFFDGDNGGLELSATKLGNTHSQWVQSVSNLHFQGRSGSYPYQLEYTSMWKKLARQGQNKAMYIVCCPRDVAVNASSGQSLRRGSFFANKLLGHKASSSWRFSGASTLGASLYSRTQLEELDCKGSLSQTRVVFFVQLDIGGSGLTSEDLTRRMGQLSNLRKYFARDLLFDAEERKVAALRAEIDKDADYTVTETGVLKKGTDLREKFRLLPTKEKNKARSNSPLVGFEVAIGVTGFGRATANINAPMMDVLAFTVNTKARNQLKKDTLVKEYLEVTGHSRIEYVVKKAPFPFDNREFLGRLAWKRYDNVALIAAAFEEEHDDFPRSPSLVRATMPYLFTVSEVSPTESKVEFVVHFDPGLAFSRKILDLYTVYQLRRVTSMQQYFQKLRTLEECGVKDGEAIGEAFMLKMKEEVSAKKKERKALRVSSLFRSYRALAELDRLHPSVKDLMISVLRNKFRKPPNVNTKLADLTEAGGTDIGRGLALALITNAIPEKAINEWFNRYPALQELDRRYPFFLPMMTAIVKRIKREAKRNARVKVYGKAALSLLDTGTDINMILFYFGNARNWYAWGIIATVAINMFLQLLIVYSQNRRMGLKRLAFEMFVTLIFLKPACDAYRVSQDEVKETNLTFIAEIEMTLSRVTEIVSESLPALVMQLTALLEAEKRANVALLSAIISASTIAVTSTTVGFDMDTSQTNRKQNPIFFGFVKNDPTSRIISFVAMFTITLSHVLMKTLATAMIFSVSGIWLALYMGCDMLFYMLFKIVRGDFRYWFNLPDPMSLIVSFFARLIGKLMIDYTLILQARHPFEAGGVLFTVIVFQTQVSCFVAAFLYLKYYQEAEVVINIVSNSTNTTDIIFNITNATDTIHNIVDPTNFTNTTIATNIINLANNTAASLAATKLPADVLWPLLIGLFALSFLSAAMLACWIDKKYLHTFTSTETGAQYAAKFYNLATTDQQRIAAIFNKHPSYYYDFKDELKEFVSDNWADWMANRPDWLTDDVIGYIDDEYLPHAEVDRLKEEGGGERRRSSVFGVEAGRRAEEDEQRSHRRWCWVKGHS